MHIQRRILETKISSLDYIGPLHIQRRVSVTKIWSTRGINRFRGARFVDDCQYEKEEKGPRRVALLLSDG